MMNKDVFSCCTIDGVFLACNEIKIQIEENRDFYYSIENMLIKLGVCIYYEC